MVKYHLAFIVLFMLSFDGLAQTNRIYSNDIEQKIREVEMSLAGWVKIEDSSLWTLQDRMAYYHIPGVSIAVIKDYKVQWARGYGLADSVDRRNVTTTTKFQAASISKSVNALGVLRVATQKQIDLHKDINEYLRTWKLPSDSFTTKQKVTLAHLLSHTAGLGVHGFRGYNQRDSLPSDNDILDGRRPSNSPAVRSLFSPALNTNIREEVL
jgi:CubicO group peptidase (beta-lactamase class C family)